MSKNLTIILVVVIAIVLIIGLTLLRNRSNTVAIANSVNSSYNVSVSTTVNITDNNFINNNIILTFNESDTEYTIINPGYYIAVIPKKNMSAGGMIKRLYIYDNGGYSNNVVYSGSNAVYGLGYIEGNSMKSDLNGWEGASFDEKGKNLEISKNDSSIIIKSYGDYSGLQYSLEWTFYAGKPYFKSVMYANETNPEGRLVNQYQFCNMLNSSNVKWYGSDEKGYVKEVFEDSMQNIQSPDADNFPIFNAQFLEEGVSLGWITVNVLHPTQVDFNTGDWQFEQQYDFYGQMGASNAIWVDQGQERNITLIYYVSDTMSNDAIFRFSKSMWDSSNATIETIDNIIHGGVFKNMFKQPTGINAEIYSPSIFLSNNLFNILDKNYAINNFTYPTTWIRIYQPYYAYKEMYSSFYQPLLESYVGDLEGSLNDGIKDYYPSKMNDVKVYNLGNGKRLEFFFNISNLYYDINFTVWNDSDKMQIDGNVKSIGGPILIKDINLVYHLDTGSSYYEAQDVTNTTNGWGIYANQMARDRNLMGYPKGETNISLTKYSINIPDGKYLVYAYLQALNTTSYYNFSFDFHNWFLINQDTNSPTLWTVHEKTYLGTADVKNGVILYEADSRDTYNGMVYIDGISVAKVDKLGNAYAIRWFDKIYDKMEQIIKSDKPIVFEDVQNTQVYDRFNARNRIVPNLKIKIYSSPTAESINVNYDFNVTLWNRIGWNNDTSGDLHSKYSQQPKYVYTPFNI